ncbi:MAG: hypothetical protein GY945_13015 [Rhodobacteraceae bacterium]|nr:hypothetical protein [Paracoccaceae bacterium]
MRTLQITLVAAALTGLSACATTPNDVSRNISPTTEFLGEEAATATSSYQVTAVNVDVPSTLVVSEANTYKPNADIVWRGDPMGNRYQQISTLMQDAFMSGASGLEGEREVVLNVRVAHFHALTERARYTVGGTHDIHFWLTIADAETGQVLEPARLIVTELTGLGGRRALAAEAQGQTQKVRISAHLRQLILQELSTPNLQTQG